MEQYTTAAKTFYILSGIIFCILTKSKISRCIKCEISIFYFLLSSYDFLLIFSINPFLRLRKMT